MLDISRAAKRRGKYLLLFANTEINNRFSVSKSVDSQPKKVSFFLKNGVKSRTMPEGAKQIIK